MLLTARNSCVVAAVLLLGSLAVRAEVATGPTGTIIMGVITEDPDPIGQLAWEPFRSIDPARVLNTGGYARGDGSPDLEVITDDPEPIGVWAYKTGSDHDIAFSEWTGASWSPTVFLTAGTDDELDPRVAVESDGTLHVVWWVPGATPEIYLTTRPSGSSSWDVPTVIGAGRRPSVASSGSALYVAFERDSQEPGMSQDVVILKRQPPGPFTVDHVLSTTRALRLDPVLHAENGHLWLDWMHEETSFGCTESLITGWNGPILEPWADSSWVGVEEMRLVIRKAMLSP